MEGQNRNIIHWILQGDLWMDKKGHLQEIRARLRQFSDEIREQRLFLEFSLFLRSYLQSKEYLENGHVLDAYNNILEALHHWARIVIIEHAQHPEVTVWKQVNEINHGVYKLYEELTSSVETLKERVQLVLLASEFSVLSKMEASCKYLFRILKSREEPWSIHELKERLEASRLHVEVALILKKLLKRGLVRQVVYSPEGDPASLKEIRYMAP